LSDKGLSVAEREGFESLGGVEKREVIDAQISTMSSFLSLKESLYKIVYSAGKAKRHRPMKMFYSIRPR